MEGGYNMIDTQPLVVGNDQKLFLFCFPKDFDIEDLNGKTIDLSENRTKPTNIDSGSQRKYTLRRESTSVHNNIRPVVKNSLDGSTAIGPAFNGTYTISEKLDLKLIPENAAPLPIRPAYVEVEQVDFLRVRSVPTGSTSTIDSITGAIVPGKEVTSIGSSAAMPLSSSPSKHAHKKRKESVDSAIVVDAEDKETSKEKKHKKKNKDKK